MILALLTPIAYIGWSLLHPFQDQTLKFALIGFYVGLVGFVLYLPLSFRVARRTGKHAVHPVVSWITFFGMGFLSFTLTFCLVKDILALVTSFVSPDIASVFESELSSYVIFILDIFCLAISVYLAQFRISLEIIKVPVRNLPSALKGFRILQLSDIHLGPTIGPKFMSRVLKMTELFEERKIIPDIVTVTGDIADAQPADVQASLDILDKLPNRLGKFYVFGNHELYWGMPAWVTEMKKRNYSVLNNESQILKINKENEVAHLAICGVTDTATAQFFPDQASDAKKALADVPTDAVRLLLCHQPHLAEANAKLGYQIQLSGHTHGGQFAPWVWAIYFFQPFVKGLYRVGAVPLQLQLYVHRGTGTWGPPFRLGAPPELALLELVAE